MTKQLELGLNIINDGEWARENYIADVLHRLTGLGEDDHPTTPGTKDPR